MGGGYCKEKRKALRNPQDQKWKGEQKEQPQPKIRAQDSQSRICSQFTKQEALDVTITNSIWLS